MKAKHIVLVIISLFICVGLFGQNAGEAAAPAAPASQGYSIVQVFVDSGNWAYAILLVFIIGLVYAIVRWNQLYRKEKIDAGGFYLKLRNYIRNDQLEEAAKIAESYKGTTMGFIFWSALMIFKDAKKSGQSGNDLRMAVQNSVEESVLQTVHKLDSGLFWFDTLAQVATYLGLLGTIWGLLEAFASLSGLTGAAQQTALTDGIKKAIGTTALGLLAAIPLTLIKGWLLTRANNVISDIDEYSVKLINTINNAIKD
ncbi:MAG TPA: MotA/TolQ/ExbB proton channel family protein [Candidatus Cloacimonas sp.]|nr:MotA/TolQ/ExbB proton channel family protein [Candidatus Cloacimonas sp.]MDD2249651.1 MotA/TolQ/ExbB proton channel family protein [Candidatus Cloacimonadota bacterium]MCK9158007.1 MotA/TolQ/ExbB proton channel family protein [Candidatus Cloacimonas sp.]MCK9165578.1 MotA/TolQ/ExbB proton channel family protein [Candidatus Cloacimonas sp.]MDD3734240.1 MotA/TolQ/ExbB proton channel family protein [Candidatus Cloacimonadota bacterium]